MDELSEGSRRLLDQLREAEAPADAAVGGGLERLRSELGEAIDAPGSGSSPSAGTGAGAAASSGKSPLLLKLALAAVVSGGTVVALVLATRPEPAPEADVAAKQVVETVPEPVTEPAIQPSPPKETTTALPPDTDDEPAQTEAEVAPPEAPARQGGGAKPSDDGSNLEEELRLVRSATAAMGKGEHGDALKLLAEHKRRFPRGVLAGERELTRAKTLCAKGDVGGARKVADRYVKRHPKSHLVARFDEVCRD